MNALKILLGITIVTLSHQTYAQKDGTLQGRWLVDIEETILRTNKYHQDKIKKMPERAQERFKKSFSNREFIFERKGKLILKMTSINNQPMESTGTWKYSAKKKELVTVFDQKPKTFIVKWEGEDFITLDYGKKAGDEGMLMFLCLRRI